eukprot:TRINITY_DN1796_c0_g2_i13.p1 TRINITY_DN1796_c0_g2~~TRINITY_DN1796_c0_g2_i13.p1  ORF type:complete len:295 (+),score=51.88 TRINITY_DN1796_c0_g2_i13:384-1268(+)
MSTYSVASSEYAESITSYLRDKEEVMCPKKTFLEHQTEISDKARSKIINWMVGCQLRFRFSNESLFLAVSLLDRFLEKQQTDSKALPLAAIAALLIAGKYEEVRPLPLDSLLNSSGEKLSSAKARSMELQVLKSLDFEVAAPTVLQFLQRACQSEKSVFVLALYICENQLVYSDMAKYPPSLIALSGFYIAKKTTCRYSRIEDLPLKEFRYGKEEVRVCAKAIVINMLPRECCELINIRKKYSAYENIANVIFNTNLLTCKRQRFNLHCLITPLPHHFSPVSYTHLTLPTICSV